MPTTVMFLFIVILTCSVSVIADPDSNSTSSKTPYEECSNSYTLGKVNRVEVVGCESTPCILHRGSSETVRIDFFLNERVNEVKANVHGILGFIPISFATPEPNACNNSGLSCPLEKGQNYSYFASIPVDNHYPRVNVKVKWELQNETGNDIICVIIPAKIA